MRTVKPYPKTNNVEIDRTTLRFAGTLLRAYRDELRERLAYASYSQQDEIGHRMNQIKETQSVISS